MVTSDKEVMFSPVSVCLSVCLLTGLLKNYRANLCEILWNGLTKSRADKLDFE